MTIFTHRALPATGSSVRHTAPAGGAVLMTASVIMTLASRLVNRTHHDRGQAQIVLAAGVAAILLLPVLLLGAVSGVLTQQAAACQAQPAASSRAATTIPATYLTDYQNTGRAWDIPWTVLAGIGETESDQGRSGAPGVHSGANAYGAAGPMQFGIGGAAGDTWGGAAIHPAGEHTGGYGIDGDHDGWVNVYDPGDAIPSAANFLRAHGAPGDMQAALLAYNHSPGYVTVVLRWAATYADGGVQAVTAAATTACEPAATGPLPAGAAGKIIAYAGAQLGKPYQWAAAGPDAFDCSGLAMMAYRAAGIDIPRTSQEQWAWGQQIPASQVEPGDLVFFAGSDGTRTSPGHVGIVIGDGKMIEAYAAGYPIRVSSYGTSSSPPGDQDPVGFTRPL